MYKLDCDNISNKVTIEKPKPRLLIMGGVGYKLNTWDEFAKVFYYNLSLMPNGMECLSNLVNKQLITSQNIKHVFVVDEEKSGYVKVAPKLYVRVNNGTFNQNIIILRRILNGTKIDFKLYISSFNEEEENAEHDLQSTINKFGKRIKSNIKSGKRVCAYINRLILSDEEKLFYRIEKEFDRCALIGDIVIDSSEDRILNLYMRQCIKSIMFKNDDILHEKVFAYGLVRFACKHYNKKGNGGFWPYFKDEYEIDLCGKSMIQGDILQKFKDVIVKSKGERYFISESKNKIDSISLHSFIVDTCADSFFDFLLDYWRIDLNRNIENMYDNPDLFDKLIEKIKDYTLPGVCSHTARAVIINPIGCKQRIRNILKKIDIAIWNPSEINNLFGGSNRINHLLRKWINNPKGLFIQERKYKGEKGSKLLSKPILLYDDNSHIFELQFNRQILTNYDESSEAIWSVESGGQKKRVHVDLLMGKSGVYTEEASLQIDDEKIFDDIKLKLVYGNTEIRYSFRKSDFRFFRRKNKINKYQYFDESFDYLSSGSFICFSTTDNVPRPLTSDYNRYSYKSFMRADYDFIKDEIVILPNQRVLKVGSKLSEGLNGGDKVKNVYITGERNSSVYSKLPLVFFKTNKEKLRGTALLINDSIKRVVDMNYSEFRIDEELNDVYGYFVDLNDCITKNGKYHVVINIPGSLKLLDFYLVYINSFAYNFSMPIITYQSDAFIYFDKKFNFKDENLNEKEVWDLTSMPSANAFLFSFDKEKDIPSSVNGSFLNLKYMNGNEQIPLSFDIPAIFWKYDLSDEWHYKQPKDIFLTDLPDKMYFTGPFDFWKCHIFIDAIDFDYDDTNIVGDKVEDGVYQFDIKRLKSYFNSNVLCRKIVLQIDDKKIPLMDGYCKTTIKSYSLVSDRTTNSIYGKFEIYGNSNYSVNIIQWNSILLEDIQLINGEFTIEDIDFESGTYEVVVYESEKEDLFGMTESETASSVEIGRYEIQIYNASDISGEYMYINGYSNVNGLEAPFVFEKPFKIYVNEPISSEIEIDEEFNQLLFKDYELCLYSKLDLNRAVFYLGTMYVPMDKDTCLISEEFITQETCLIIFKDKKDLANPIILVKNKKDEEYSMLCYDKSLKRFVLKYELYSTNYIKGLKKGFFTEKKLLQKYRRANWFVLEDDIILLNVDIKE